MNAKADRYNSGKPKYSMIDMGCLEQCARVLEYGANKYARDNWRKGLPFSEILDSLLRHVAALQRGELIDPESGMPHIGHVQCNALFLGNSANVMDIDVDQPLLNDIVTELQQDSDDAMGFTYEPLTHDPGSWSDMKVEKVPVSMEEYDKFVKQLMHGDCGFNLGDKNDR